MAKLKSYDLLGKEVGEEEIQEDLLDWSVNDQMTKDYLVALRNNKRQWSACTKGRSEVAHGGAKPHPQKGTGKARQGSLASPQYKGGGRVFGPKPKFDQHTRINRKEKRAIINSLLSGFVKNGQALVLKYEAQEAPKTKELSSLLNTLSLSNNKILFLSESENMYPKYENLAKSLRNLPKVKFLNMQNINGYEIANSNSIVFLEGSLDQLKKTLKRA